MYTWEAFIAYASPDRPSAKTQCDALARRGAKVFVDQECLGPRRMGLPAAGGAAQVVLALD